MWEVYECISGKPEQGRKTQILHHGKDTAARLSDCLNFSEIHHDSCNIITKIRSDLQTQLLTRYPCTDANFYLLFYTIWFFCFHFIPNKWQYRFVMEFCKTINLTFSAVCYEDLIFVLNVPILKRYRPVPYVSGEFFIPCSATEALRLFILCLTMIVIIIFLSRTCRMHAWSLYLSKPQALSVLLQANKYCPLIFIL